jgi:PAS domain S-box-containing protein
MNASATETQLKGQMNARETSRMILILRLVYSAQVIAWALVLNNDPDPGTPTIGMACILFSIACLVMVHFRQLTIPRFCAPMALLAALLYLLFTGGSIQDHSVVLFPLVILFGALTFGRTGAVVYSILSVAAAAAVVLAETEGLFKPEPMVTSRGDLLDFVIMLGVVLVVLWIMIGNTRSDLREAVESEARYRLLADNVTDVVWVRDVAADKLLYCSPSMMNQRGYTPEEFMALSIEDSVKPEYLPDLLKIMQEEYQAQIAGHSEPERWRTVTHEVYCKDGTSIWVENVCSFIQDEHGETRLLGVSRDISQRKADEKAREKVQERVQSTQKMESIGLLAGGIAHDFNNLLQGIIGNADIALEKLPKSNDARENLDELLISSNRAADLCAQLLAYAGKGMTLIQPMNLSDLVGEMANLLKMSISKKAVLKMDLDSDLPTVEIDPTQIRQIVMNLIINAADAIEDNDGTITVTTKGRFCDQGYLDSFAMGDEATEGMYVILEVSDTGRGIDEATQTKIFDPFYTSKELGHGLGLAAVLGIVRSHQGGIKVYSEVGAGTTFKILLPAGVEEAIQRTRTDVYENPARGEGLVLIVDDENAILNLGRHALGSHGYEVLTATDGFEALDVYHEHGEKIRAVVLDMTMPRMGGEETYRQLRALNPDLPVILSSGFGEQEAIEQYLAEGLAGFLQKPYHVAELLSMVANACSSSEKSNA